MLSSLTSITNVAKQNIIPRTFSLLYPSSMLFWFKGGTADKSGSQLKNYANNAFEGTIVNSLPIDTTDIPPTASAVGITGSFNMTSTSSYYQDGLFSVSSTQIANGFTYCFWIKTSISSSQNTAALGIWNNVDYTNVKPGISIMYSGPTSFTLEQWCGGNYNTQLWNINTSYYQTWVHLCVTIPPTGGNFTFYKNGSVNSSKGTQQGGTFNYPANTATRYQNTLGQIPFMIDPAYNVGYGYGCQSRIADFRLYNRVLTASEIADIYAGYG